MNVYVFGNPDLWYDKIAFEISDKLKKDFPNINFIKQKVNEDIHVENEENFVLLDPIQGLKSVKVFDESAIDKLVVDARSTVHDFDLGFQLKYLKKLGKIKKATIIGLPMNEEIDYSSIHSIFKKLVEHDMHGS